MVSACWCYGSSLERSKAAQQHLPLHEATQVVMPRHWQRLARSCCQSQQAALWCYGPCLEQCEAGQVHCWDDCHLPTGRLQTNTNKPKTNNCYDWKQSIWWWTTTQHLFNGPLSGTTRGESVPQDTFILSHPSHDLRHPFCWCYGSLVMKNWR